MSSYPVMQLDLQILAASEQLIFSVVWCFVILLITGLAIWRYQSVGQVVQLWAAMGTVTGAMAGYFFTRQEVERQQSQIKMIESALQASEKQRLAAGVEVLQVARAIKYDVPSKEVTQGWVKSLEIAVGKLEPAATYNLSPVLTHIRRSPSPSPHATEPDKFNDLFKRNAPSPSPEASSP